VKQVRKCQNWLQLPVRRSLKDLYANKGSECLPTAQFHRPITDLPGLPRYSHNKDLHVESRPTLLKGVRVKTKFLGLIYYVHELRKY
jgi:hypothetical protein